MSSKSEFRYHHDDRRAAYCNVFPDMEQGDVNVSVIQPRTAIFWHRHRCQTDRMIVLSGDLKVGMTNMSKHCTFKRPSPLDEPYDWEKNWPPIYHLNYCLTLEKYKIQDKRINSFTYNPKVEWFYLSDRNANEGSIIVPAGLWHGSFNYSYSKEAVLLYYITPKYTGEDEDRATIESMGWDYLTEVK